VEIGTDIESILRIAAVLERTPRFKTRCFTEKEIAYCESKGKKSAESFAARFCAKEAFSKAIGQPLNWHDVETLNNADGKPEVYVKGRAHELLAGRSVKVSLSHAENMAIATVIIF